MSSKLKAPPKYLCFLDFEATCEDGATMPNEIIEFPMIMARAAAGGRLEYLGEFHQYVKPVTNPVLTDFCKNLTGIQQETVDAAQPLSVVLPQAAAWVEEVTGNEGSEVAFVTCGAWDINKCLPQDCASKGLAVPATFKCFINIKDAVKRRGVEVRHMGELLGAFGLEFEGHPHSGIDDTRNIARAAEAFLKRGWQFEAKDVRRAK
eukprot:GDKI01004674.1.p1 GENE.GDKI01004674.1~~GDKI01004674.1.p1  ORF type:complete len:206 (-),score=55.44 GDKI01004674.1:153-770(-)